MGVNKLDIQREQLAHGKTREALEKALADLAARPKWSDVEAAEARAGALAALLAGRPTAAQLNEAMRRAEDAEAKAARHLAELQSAPAKAEIEGLKKTIKRLEADLAAALGTDHAKDAAELRREMRRLEHEMKQAGRV